MKTKKMTAVTLLLLLTGSGICLAQSGQSQFAVPLSNPGKPGSLDIELVQGSINVTGYNGKDVIVQYNLNREMNHSRRDEGNVPPGMKRIPSNNGGLEARESDNNVKIDTEYPNSITKLDIKVPVNFSLNLSTVNSGDIIVNGVHGDLDLNNVNGNIDVSDVSGSANATTVNGDIVATFSSLDRDTPMAFSTLNGKIDITLPAKAKFSTKMKTFRGSIYTDFDMTLTHSGKTKMVSGSNNGEFRISVDDWQYGKVNGGGPELMFKSFNGNIYIRKK